MRTTARPTGGSAFACACAAALLLPAAARALDQAGAACVLDAAAQKLLRADARLSPGAYPKATGADGRWGTVPAGDALGWTQGFFPGSLWLLYEATGEEKWRARAAAWTTPLAVQRTNGASHDLGFKLVPSYGAMERLTGDAASRAILLDAARLVAGRFDDRIGAVKCCDWNPDWAFPVVVDTMVNLDLLFRAAELPGGDPAWRDVALRHALTTARDLVRADGGTYHVVDYDPATGAIRSRGTFQGAGAETTWSRGQTWAMYGFALAYRHTRDARMLAAARKTTAYWLDHVPESGVPNWDFDAARVAPDSSAAASAASALLLLAGEVTGAEAQRYRDAAHRALDALASPAFLDASGSEALLLHGVGDLPHGKEIDVGLVYGDHYFLEAVLRAFPKPGACARPSPSPPAEPFPTPSPTPTATPGDPVPTPTPSPEPTTSAGGARSSGCSTGTAGALALLAPLALRLRALRRRR